jgi:hypothetical protein
VSMKRIFSFFIRLFVAFLASKLFLGLLGADTPASLLGFSVLLVLGTYALEIWGAKIGWMVARLLISMNQLPSRRGSKQAPRE